MSYLLKTGTASRQWVENYTPQAGETLVETIPPGLTPYHLWDGAQWVFNQALKDAADAQVSTASALDTQAANALANLRAYRDNAAPSNAQTVAVIKLICSVLIGLIRLRLNQLDSTQ